MATSEEYLRHFLKSERGSDATSIGVIGTLKTEIGMVRASLGDAEERLTAAKGRIHALYAEIDKAVSDRDEALAEIAENTRLVAKLEATILELLEQDQ